MNNNSRFKNILINFFYANVPSESFSKYGIVNSTHKYKYVVLYRCTYISILLFRYEKTTADAFNFPLLQTFGLNCYIQMSHNWWCFRSDDLCSIVYCCGSLCKLMGTHIHITSRYMPTAHKAYDICVSCSRPVTYCLAVISDVTLIKYVCSLITCELHSIRYFIETHINQLLQELLFMAFHRGHPNSIPGQFMWDWGMFSPGTSVRPANAIPLPLSVLRTILYSLDTDE
jgi:hypothetical protein